MQMPTAGLSLVGFLDREQAIAHLRSACVPADTDDSALTREWAAAKAKLDAPMQKAGLPSISPLPANYDPYKQSVLSQAAFQHGGSFQGASVCLVEIEPILAVQFTIDLARVKQLCGVLHHPTIDEMLEICLPLKPRAEEFQAVPGPQSILLKSRSMNVKISASGLLQRSFLGVRFGISSPHVRVVRHNGRCYMQNGFHRAVGLGMAGAVQMPCLLRDVTDLSEAGIVENATFSAARLESGNPPTLAHFIRGRAHAVMLRSLSRVLHVSWAEYTIPEE
jgi:hypothetical protein